MICAVMKLFVVDFFKKRTLTSDKDQDHFNKFVTKYSSQSNAFAILYFCGIFRSAFIMR